MLTIPDSTFCIVLKSIFKGLPGLEIEHLLKSALELIIETMLADIYA